MKRSMFSVFIVGLCRMLSGTYKNPKTHIDEEIVLKSSKNKYTVFKQSILTKREAAAAVYFEIEFSFKKGVPKIFSPTIPFFLGMPGFISKFWLVDKQTGAYAGQYVFASREDAEGYGNSVAQKLVKSLCVPGEYKWSVVEIKNN